MRKSQKNSEKLSRNSEDSFLPEILWDTFFLVVNILGWGHFLKIVKIVLFRNIKKICLFIIFLLSLINYFDGTVFKTNYMLTKFIYMYFYLIIHCTICYLKISLKEAMKISINILLKVNNGIRIPNKLGHICIFFITLISIINN